MRTIEKLVHQYNEGAITRDDLLTYAVYAIPRQGVEHVVNTFPSDQRDEFIAWLKVFERSTQNLTEGGYHPFPEEAHQAVEEWQRQLLRQESTLLSNALLSVLNSHSFQRATKLEIHLPSRDRVRGRFVPPIKKDRAA